MGEISSEMKSVPMENNVLNQNSDDFRRLVLGKQVLEAGQGDHVNGQQQQQQLHQSGDNNTLLASQEIPGSPNGVVGNERVRKVKEKPKLVMTNEKKPRLRWTKELHACFVDVCNQLGGSYRATPKAILNLMEVDGLNVFHIKSHLQKYRLGKYADKELTEAGNTGSSSGVTPSNSVRNGNGRGGRNSKNQMGELYLKLEAEKYVQRYLEAQRSYLYTALERACNELSSQSPGHGSDGTMGKAALYRQAMSSLRNSTNIPAAPSGFETSAMTMPTIYLNQHNAYPTYNTPTTPANHGLRQPPFGYQQQASSSHAAPQGDFSSSAGYSGSSSYQKTTPAVESNVDWSDDDDLIRTLLNWDDDEPKNLDTGF
ncbi:hypothetical protein V6N11_041312 [Hibiscus sabdariffa]|uniref:Myb-like domain-containing protein n=1 Tax=Hibiscus sabdariffa TaxID=183260 RepID=A0ABR2RKH4_9ROSI